MLLKSEPCATDGMGEDDGTTVITVICTDK